MLLKNCEVCGKEFNATPWKDGQPVKRFCSRTCINHGRGRKPVPDAASFQRPCEMCGQIFDATPSRPAYDKPNRFCSSCIPKGRGLPQRKRVRLACEQCGKAFEVPRSWAERRTGKHATRFCSKECSWESQRKPRASSYNKRMDSLRVTRDGYIERYMPNHPSVLEKRSKGGRPRRYIKEHRLVMEQIIGRPLVETESVHHKDGNRANNDPSNLELWIKPQPSGIRASDLIEYVVTYHRAAVLASVHDSPT